MIRITAATCLCVAALVLATATAGGADRPAQATASTTAPVSTTTLPPPELLGGVTVTGAVVHTPGQPDRKLDGNQATAFMQSWFPDSVFNKLPNVPRPTGVPISRIVATTRWQDQDIPITVFYANKNGEVLVGMPAQSFGWALVQSEKWIDPPQQARVTKAFEGKLQPVRSPVAPTTTTTTTVPKKDDSSSSAVPWIVLGIGIVVVVAGAVVLIVRSRKTPAGG